MNTKLGPYPKYKDSGIPWLGQIPEHWDVRRNGRLFAQRNETGFGELPILEVSLRTGVRVRDMDNLKRKQVMSDAEKYKRAAKGDIAYNMMRMWQGALGTAPVDGLVSPAYVVARPFEEANPYYYSYLFRTEGYKAEVDGYSRGIVKDRNRLYWQDFKRMPSCFPPPEEQAAIVSFLNVHAAIVRRFIRNRRRLIDVLSEQKQTIINRVVLQGIDSSVELKDSSIGWLGHVPKHWELLRAKYLLQEIDSRSTDGTEQLLSVSQHSGVSPKTDEDRTGMPRAANHIGYKRVQPNEFVVNIMIAWNGSFGVSDYEGIVSPAYAVYRFQRDVDPYFFDLLLRTNIYLWRIKSASTGVIDSRLRLYSDELGRIELLVPPLEEQSAIAAKVKEMTENLTAAVQQMAREVNVAMEYHARLIEDVVRGAVDIRELRDVVSNWDLGDESTSEDIRDFENDDDFEEADYEDD